MICECNAIDSLSRRGDGSGIASDAYPNVTPHLHGRSYRLVNPICTGVIDRLIGELLSADSIRLLSVFSCSDPSGGM